MLFLGISRYSKGVMFCVGCGPYHDVICINGYFGWVRNVGEGGVKGQNK